MIGLVHGVVLFGAFAILWFLSLLIVMPIGAGEADEAGAPKAPRLLFKAGIATAIAVVLWGIFYALILTGVLDM